MATAALLEALLGASRWLGVRELHYHEATNTIIVRVAATPRIDHGVQVATVAKDFPEFAFRILRPDEPPPADTIVILRRKPPRGRSLP